MLVFAVVCSPKVDVHLGPPNLVAILIMFKDVLGEGPDVFEFSRLSWREQELGSDTKSEVGRLGHDLKSRKRVVIGVCVSRYGAAEFVPSHLRRSFPATKRERSSTPLLLSSWEIIIAPLTFVTTPRYRHGQSMEDHLR
jgi:hypothetical protein